MIKFFRKIRYNLMSENKTGKYFKYAIGEIILVVIGILIALQINTWNNNKIDEKKEKEYLNNLIEDINIQKLLVNGQINHESNMKLKCEKALSHLNSASPNTDSLNIYLANITRKSFVINNPTFQDLKSSGNILLIKNNELRKKVLSFYQYLDYIALVVQTSNEKSISEFRDFLLKNSVINLNYKDSITVAESVDWSLKSIDVPWAKTIQEKRLKNKESLLILLNHISQRGRVSSVHLDLMQKMEKRIDDIQSDIETYLKS
ncbi:DUF6090 family protein [Winogradskyella sp. PE311]|uniref:DUF6090 family protein n=1 Tax=Winogradskyella sp. PE311 TaxID=3366943 RepID=UPI00397F9C31